MRVWPWIRRIGVALIVFAVVLALPVLPPMTITQHAVPRGTDSVVVRANEKYRAGPLREVFQGSHYRELWTIPIKVPVLDLGSYEGGMVHDQTSSSFPAGALVAMPLQAAAGLPAGRPRLVIIPDDARLGEYRERYAGLLGLLQEGPEESVRRLPRAAGVTEVKDTEEVLPLVDSTSSHRLDGRGHLTARLLDLMLNDWDRHEGQWRWAGVPATWGTEWLPIPVDRDQAFSWYDGLIMDLVRLRTPKLANYGPGYSPMRGATWNSREPDRRLLSGLERAVWDSIAAFLVSRFTDSVIGEAVRELPPAYYDVAAPLLVTTLQRRREGLRAAAGRLYGWLAKAPEVRATGEAEPVALTHHADGSVEIRLAGCAGEPAWFSRRYHPAETGRLDVYLGGGKDRLAVTGSPARGITVRLFDPSGRLVAGESTGPRGAP